MGTDELDEALEHPSANTLLAAEESPAHLPLRQNFPEEAPYLAGRHQPHGLPGSQSPSAGFLLQSLVPCVPGGAGLGPWMPERGWVVGFPRFSAFLEVSRDDP